MLLSLPPLLRRARPYRYSSVTSAAASSVASVASVASSSLSSSSCSPSRICAHLPRRRSLSVAPARAAAAPSIASAPAHARRPSSRSHMDLTQHTRREQEHWTPVTIEAIHTASSTVRVFDLRVAQPPSSPSPPLTFLPGQWLDVQIPGVDLVGGYSICSTPRHLRTTGHLELAVKAARHSPAHWMHHQARVGDQLLVRTGGDLTYDGASGAPTFLRHRPIVLLAGGVGINPLLSIWRARVEEYDYSAEHGDGNTAAPTSHAPTIMLFSAKTESDLLFRREIERTVERTSRTARTSATPNAASLPPFSHVFAATRASTAAATNDSPSLVQPPSSSWSLNSLHHHRFDAQLIRLVLDTLRASSSSSHLPPPLFYLCGPPHFLDDWHARLQRDAHIPAHDIRFERWW